MLTFRKTLQPTLIAIALFFIPQATSAQTFPSRPITLIVPFAAGGPTDAYARIVGGAMARFLGQAIVIENVAGAGGAIGSLRAARANNDGHTILMGQNGTH